MIADTFICSPTLGIWFDTDAVKSTACNILDKEDRESGQYDSISIKVHGKERKMRQLYMNETEEGTNVIASRFVIRLRKAEPSVVAEMKSKRQKITHDVSSDTSLVSASNTTVVSSPIAIEEPRPLPPKKQFLQRMQVSEVSLRKEIRHTRDMMFKCDAEYNASLKDFIENMDSNVSRASLARMDRQVENLSRDLERLRQELESISIPSEFELTVSYRYTRQPPRSSSEESSSEITEKSSRKRKRPSPDSTPPPEPDTDIDSDDEGNDQEVEVFDDTGKKSKKPDVGHTISHHRANNIMAMRAGLDSNDQELAEYLEKHDMSCLEEMYLVTGDSQVEDELLRRSRLDVALENMEEVVSREKVPQGQCDVDHCMHRSHWISNSIYLCFPMSHTANTCNSIIRRRAKDWLYCLTIHEYTNGA